MVLEVVVILQHEMGHCLHNQAVYHSGITDAFVTKHQNHQDEKEKYLTLPPEYQTPERYYALPFESLANNLVILKAEELIQAEKCLDMRINKIPVFEREFDNKRI